VALFCIGCYYRQYVFLRTDRIAEGRLLTMRILELKDVVSVLRGEVQRAGGVSAWSKKTGVNRTIVSKVLNDLRAPPKSMIKALKLRTVFVVSKDSAK
jgi:DNA-binding phage protein